MPALQRWYSHLGVESGGIIFIVVLASTITDAIQEPFDMARAVPNAVPNTQVRQIGVPGAAPPSERAGGHAEEFCQFISRVELFAAHGHLCVNDLVTDGRFMAACAPLVRVVALPAIGRLLALPNRPNFAIVEFAWESDRAARVATM